MSKLKKCPFCGKYPQTVVDDETEEKFGVKCFNCGGAIYPEKDTLDEAIEAWNNRAGEQNEDKALPSAQPEITKEYDLKKIYSIYVKIAQAHFVYQPSKPKAITAMPFDWIETQNLLEKYLKDNGADFDALCREYISENVKDDHLPSAEPERDIPVKPDETIDRAWGIPNRQAVCLNCDCYLGMVQFLNGGKRKVTYCESCGQAIDWEGWEEDETD